MRWHQTGERARGRPERWPWIVSALAHGAALVGIVSGVIEVRSSSASHPVVIEIELVRAPSPVGAKPEMAVVAAAPIEDVQAITTAPPIEPEPPADPVVQPAEVLPAVADVKPPSPSAAAASVGARPPSRQKPIARRPSPAAAASASPPPVARSAIETSAVASASPQLAALPPSVGRPGADEDYLASILAWLEKHKEYPREAQRRRQQGTAVLAFELDRQGRVLTYRIKTSSGFAELDREVEAMIKRAEPLPPMPADMAQAKLELQVPVQFRLR